MDLTDSDDAQQKTSPPQGSATMSSLTAAFSALASQLAAHYHQLNRLTSLTEELEKAIQTLQTPAPDPSPVQTLPPAARSTEIQPSASASPGLALPEKFNGDPGKCKGLYFAMLTLHRSATHALFH